MSCRGGDESRGALALTELLSDFEAKQHSQLVLAIDKAVNKTMRKQNEMLQALRTKVEARHRLALCDLCTELARAQPTMIESLISRTLDVQKNPGLVSWMGDDDKRDEAVACLTKLRHQFETSQGNAFRSDFEALLGVYIEYLEIPIVRGTRLNNRIEDLHQGLLEKAGTNQDLINLVHRVRWACFGVRAIGSARLPYDTTKLSENEILELCGCFSAIGVGMPRLALEFDVCKKLGADTSPTSDTSSNSPTKSNGSMDLKVNMDQLREAASSAKDQTPFEYVMDLMNNRGFNMDPTASPPGFDGTQANCLSSLLPRYSNDSFSLSDQASPMLSGSGLNDLNFTGLNLNSSTFNSLNLNSFDARQEPPLSRLGSIGSSNSSSTSQQQTSMTFRCTDSSGRVWSQPPHLNTPPRNSTQFSTCESPIKRSPYSLRGESPLKMSSSADTPRKRLMQQSPNSSNKLPDVPSQANLTLAKSLKFYYDRPTELPKESDRVRKAMFARMLNHMNELPKAALCPLMPGHDDTCPLSHTYLEVMSYNPLFKRLVCRQTSHYWGSQIREDDTCVCLHVDTGLTWEWMDEARDKRFYCLRGAKCINPKCFKSHSFEEMCWYNPSYKIKRCTVRAHEHILRSRGTIAPPLDCSYYHIEEGKNADKRDFAVESDHVGKDVKMLFIERTHKPLADLLEALRYARANNL
ncbi:hypothetical protein PsorP6_013559 [Peronosclerospora sorghi]|uniref:Uncharacterized protein n=1 Tax=Peronosclerospora sorghi TaxID=230839 RepID=A0ACC0VIW5_9STRA|nr:hypothetical protein PsorP6_013559 [Peronosclerospora sorghi]